MPVCVHRHRRLASGGLRWTYRSTTKAILQFTL
jgi:hypothetical protein